MKKPVITISGLPGSGSTTTSRSLASILDLKSFSPGQLFKDISHGKFSQRQYYSLFLDICRVKGIHNFNSCLCSENGAYAAVNLWDTSLGKDPRFHEAIDELQLRLSEIGGYVIDGKLSLYHIKDADMKIWLEISLEERAKRMSKRENIPLDDAKFLIEGRESREGRHWKRIYGFDYTKQDKLADLVIKDSSLNPEQMVKLILQNYKAPPKN